MIAHGVDPKMPSEPALLHYGANQTWLVLHGQWYRLLTAIFVHVGLFHLATNMWCLWNLGILGEPLIGPYENGRRLHDHRHRRPIYQHGLQCRLKHIHYSDPGFLHIPGAGASGAVFGIAGILIVLLQQPPPPVPLG